MLWPVWRIIRQHPRPPQEAAPAQTSCSFSPHAVTLGANSHLNIFDFDCSRQLPVVQHAIACSIRFWMALQRIGLYRILLDGGPAIRGSGAYDLCRHFLWPRSPRCAWSTGIVPQTPTQNCNRLRGYAITITGTLVIC